MSEREEQLQRMQDQLRAYHGFTAEGARARAEQILRDAEREGTQLDIPDDAIKITLTHCVDCGRELTAFMGDRGVRISWHECVRQRRP